jgi:hypothetical protein
MAIRKERIGPFHRTNIRGDENSTAVFTSSGRSTRFCVLETGTHPEPRIKVKRFWLAEEYPVEGTLSTAERLSAIQARPYS